MAQSAAIKFLVELLDTVNRDELHQKLVARDTTGTPLIHNLIRDYNSAPLLKALKESGLLRSDDLQLQDANGVSLIGAATKVNRLDAIAPDLLTEEILLTPTTIEVQNGNQPHERAPIEVFVLLARDMEELWSKFPAYIFGQPKVLKYLRNYSDRNDRQLDHFAKSFQPIGIDRAKRKIQNALSRTPSK